ncbi:MAG: hypothetical protein AABX93_02225 [Nanoarchaeota archaeon]
MEPLLIIPFAVSLFFVLFSMNFWIKKAHQIGLIWEDIHKINKNKVAGSGGIVIVLGFLAGVLSYIALNTFYFNSTQNLIQILALSVSVLIVSGVGLIDDLFGWQHGGLSIRSRLVLVIFAAVPLMVINAGTSTIIGIDVGLIYPLILIPLGIVGASTTFNMLAGYNGLESSQGILILGALSIVTYITGARWLSLISLIMVLCLFAFYLFNRFPAKVFPGDVLTYPVGAMIAIVAILGNVEKIAVFFFIPYILETILKTRGRLKKESFAKLNPDETLEVPYEKFYGLEHVAVYLLKKIKPSKKVYEKDVVYLINFFQIAIIAAGFILFGNDLRT